MESKEFRFTEDLLATQGQRVANFFIDLAMRYVLIFILGILIALTANLLDFPELLFWLQTISTVEDYLISFVIMIIYYLIFEATLSRSVGKYITKTKVVMCDGSKPDFGTIVKRTLCRFIPFDALSFLGSNGRGWHDTITDTCVVKNENFEEEMRMFYEFNEIGKEIEI